MRRIALVGTSRRISCLARVQLYQRVIDTKANTPKFGLKCSVLALEDLLRISAALIQELILVQEPSLQR